MALTQALLRKTWLLFGAAVLVSILTYWTFQSESSAPNDKKPLEIKHSASTYPPSPLSFTAGILGPEPTQPPRVANVRIADLDQDDLPDVLVCDARQKRVFWYRQFPRGQWTEHALTDEMPTPANTTVVDIDKDGDLDVLVSILGYVWPNDERIGQVVLLENDGHQKMTAKVLLDDVRRVTDVQPGDLDQDGDLDLVVAVFGFDRGELLWLENRGQGQFRDHQLLSVPGCLYVPLADYDNDGDLDVVTFASQEDEQLIALENLGGKTFQPKLHVLDDTLNFDLGSAAFIQTDLDKDGDPDLLLAAGDNLDGLHHYPQPWHGCIWYENQGSWKFARRQISDFGGTYGVAAGDVDGDKDVDVVLVSMFNDWKRDGAASVVWLENDGKQNFKTWQIADKPIFLATVACGDLNGDGWADIVAGGLRLDRGTDRMGRLVTWTPKGKSK